MSDEFLTDEEQVEAIKRFLVENGPWLLAGALLGAALLFGYRYYQSHRNGRALAAAALFNQMTAAVDRHDAADARRIATQITGGYDGTPYADQAELTLARLAVDDGKLAAAETLVAHVVDSTKDDELKKIASLRLARIEIAEGQPDQALKSLSGMQPGAFAALFHEVRGDALVAKKDRDGAIAEYRAALAASDPRFGDNPLLTLKIADLG
ncbi:MAG: tetratricopeptide repeat protein, partial [Gammaproteobacteria bacterium]|nr:tetratricopeptide repeat protein [Gammaproteobacteria bacterium]